MKIKVEVRKSAIPNAGNGVFATEDIKKGERVCYYDGEDIEASKVNICETDMSYALTKVGEKEPWTRLGFEFPKTLYGVGQICNDGAYPIFRDEHDFKMVVEDLDIYTKKSMDNLNVAQEDKNSFWFVALRDIQKGEELFYSYGPKYWMSKFLKESTNSFFRLICGCYVYNFHLEKVDDKEALNIIENLMNQDTNLQFWTDRFKISSPKDVLLQITKQLKIT